MCIVLRGYLHVLGAPSIKSCCTLSISASLTCIRLWYISQIQTFLGVVVGPGFASTSPAIIVSCASHPVGRMAGLPKKTVNRTGGVNTIATRFDRPL